MQNKFLHVYGTRERNLKNVSVSIPKNQITVFTGVSGSGKSSLVFDTIAAESQRQLNENHSSFIQHRLPQYGQPDMDGMENLPVSFIISQKRLGGNTRSTVGTITDIYSLLRLLYSRMGKPFVGYAEVFSFNSPKGMCKTCHGTGKVDTIDIDRLLDRDKSLLEGAILFPTFEPGGWRLRRYLYSGLFDNDKKLRDFNEEEMNWLLYRTDKKLPNPDPQWPKTAQYEGVIPRIERTFLHGESEERSRHKKKIDSIVARGICADCGSYRLSSQILSCKIAGKNIGECASMQSDDLLTFLHTLECPPPVKPVLIALQRQLKHMVSIGLGYLSLNRETSTLSGGESQRIKILRQLGSSLTDVAYILDEPSIGLHPHDVNKVNALLRQLRDKGNTLLVVEHDPDIIRIADHIVDMGPRAGSNGGNVVFEGTYDGLAQADTLTAKHLGHTVYFKKAPRRPAGYIAIKNATLHNLKNVNVNIPKKILTIVTGVAGSGKSSLINGVLPKLCTDCIMIDQKPLHASKRSTIATITGIFDDIRKKFAQANRVAPSLFSFNSKGACPACKGLGKIYTDLAFMDTVVTTCEVCRGNRYTHEVLQYTLKGKNIAEILSLTINNACRFFAGEKTANTLSRLSTVGLGYITLGQTLDTLSGGELQRVKLAAELGKKGQIYILDEPTTGLHMADVAQLMEVLDKLVSRGNTLIVIEHNLEVLAQADWVIDLGPGAGQKGGTILFEGTPQELSNTSDSITGRYLKKYMQHREQHNGKH